MTPEQKDALLLILGYIDAYECGLCGGDTAGQHSDGCPVLVLRAMVQEQQTLYDWSGVPEWVQWIAMDSDGYFYYYGQMPYKEEDYWTTRGAILRSDVKTNRLINCSEWQNSLEKRPSNI